MLGECFVVQLLHIWKPLPALLMTLAKGRVLVVTGRFLHTQQHKQIECSTLSRGSGNSLSLTQAFCGALCNQPHAQAACIYQHPL